MLFSSTRSAYNSQRRQQVQEEIDKVQARSQVHCCLFLFEHFLIWSCSRFMVCQPTWLRMYCSWFGCINQQVLLCIAVGLVPSADWPVGKPAGKTCTVSSPRIQSLELDEQCCVSLLMICYFSQNWDMSDGQCEVLYVKKFLICPF